ncbi:helix-turn-helix domain-containing protein [Microbulbifer sp. JTAC008]
MSYCELSESERYHIYCLRKSGHSQKAISILLGQYPSTINRDL